MKKYLLIITGILLCIVVSSYFWFNREEGKVKQMISEGQYNLAVDFITQNNLILRDSTFFNYLVYAKSMNELKDKNYLSAYHFLLSANKKHSNYAQIKIVLDTLPKTRTFILDSLNSLIGDKNYSDAKKYISASKFNDDVFLSKINFINGANSFEEKDFENAKKSLTKVSNKDNLYNEATSMLEIINYNELSIELNRNNIIRLSNYFSQIKEAFYKLFNTSAYWQRQKVSELVKSLSSSLKDYQINNQNEDLLEYKKNIIEFAKICNDYIWMYDSNIDKTALMGNMNKAEFDALGSKVKSMQSTIELTEKILEKKYL